VNDTSLGEVRDLATALSPWAHLATVGPDGAPDVVPVHPCWEDDTLWIMVGRSSVKARNAAHEPRVALHWQVTEVGDGVELWGRASLDDDLATKRRLWSGVFDYDLNLFAPGGPDDSPDTIFMRVDVDRVMVMKAYGMGGVRRWTRRSEEE
jgi:general stress protein 26